MTLKEIKEMNEYRYREMIRIKCNEQAFKYLTNKRGSKGKEIQYTRIQMSQYLQPNDKLDINEQKKIFEIRNRMTNIPANYPGTKQNDRKCICGKLENMEHIYYCKKLNKTEMMIEYEHIYKGNIENMKIILKRIEENMKKREEFSHVIQYCDPPVLAYTSLAMDNE